MAHGRLGQAFSSHIGLQRPRQNNFRSDKMSKSSILILSAIITGSQCFVPQQFHNKATTTPTELRFGIPTFGPKDDEDDQVDEKLVKKDVGLKGLVQLITAGAGAPFLGDFQGVDKETGNFMFSLEANNLVDEDGQSKQTSMPYFESGWVDPEDLAKEEKKKQEGGFKFPWQN